MAERLHAPPHARPGQPDWSVEGAHWPHRPASQFWRVGRTIWHIQRMGSGPTALLIHGTGAATHSWDGLMPLLAEGFDVLALDLPGQGFTRPAPGFVPSLGNMTGAIAELLRALELDPAVLVGHSAGAAIATRLASESAARPTHIVSLNGALRPFPGFLRHIAPTMAKTLTLGGVAANMFSQAARDRNRVERLLEQTGGAPGAGYVDNYQRLLQCSAHVSSTLSMMANWDLGGIETDLKGLDTPFLFVAGATDQAISPAEARRLASVARKGEARRLPHLGHLAHEKDPASVMDALGEFLSRNTKSP